MTFYYTSKQVRRTTIRGKTHTRINSVDIKNGHGTKTVQMYTVKKGKKSRTKTSKKRLTRKELTCIRKCKFIPGLFNDCMECLRYKDS